MTEKETIETGFVVDISKGLIKKVKFARKAQGSLWGIDPESGRVSWVFGDWTLDKDLFLSKESAMAAGETAKTKRIESLRKQLAKLEKMSFNSP